MTQADISRAELLESEEFEHWISGIQNGETNPHESSGRLEQIAASLLSVGQQTPVQPEQDLVNDCGSDGNYPDIPGYDIVDVLGRGGMGIVFRANDLQLKRTVALKVLPDNQFRSARAKKRFRIEVQAAAQLDHPSIVPVFEFGEYDGGLYYSMREIDGIDLAQKLRADDSSGPAEDEPTTRSFGPDIHFASNDYQQWVAHVGKSIADALAHSHEQLVIHRDVKPANIIISRDGEPFLTDFGLARIREGSDLTEDTDLLGTIRYMSPEQIDGSQQVDPRMDVYALGVTLYELLTGKPAVDQDNVAAAWKQIKDGRIAKPSASNPRIDADLETVVLKAMAPEPEQRYVTAREMAEDLERFLNIMPIMARRPTIALKLNRWTKRNRSWVATLAIVAGTLLGVILSFAIYNSIRASQDATIIRQRSADLLDKSGVEQLFQTDALRAKDDFLQASVLTAIPEERQTQLRRIAAIENWSPRLIETQSYNNRLLASHHNGLRVITSTTNGMTVCEVQQGEQTNRILQTDRNVESSSVSPDGSLIAITIGDRTNKNPEVMIYDCRSKQVESLTDELEWRISDLWFLNDNQSLLITGWSGDAQLWDCIQLKKIKSHTYPSMNAGSPWVFAARTDNERQTMVAVVNPGLLVGLKLPEMEPLWDAPIELSDWKADAIALSPDGRWVAIGLGQDAMRVWETKSGRELTLPGNTRARPTIASFSHDGRHLAMGDDVGGVYVWKMPDDPVQPVQRHGVVMWHDLSIASLRFNENDQLAVATNNSVRIWRLRDNEPLSPSIPVDSQVRRVDWTADGKISVLIRKEGIDQLQTWGLPVYLESARTAAGKLSGWIETNERTHPLVQLSDKSDQPLFYFGSEVGGVGRKESQGLARQSLIYSAKSRRLSFSGDHSRMATWQFVDDAPELTTYDCATLQQVGNTVTLPSVPADIGLDFNGQRWITSGFDERVAVGEVKSGATLHEYVLPNWVIDSRFLDRGDFASICWDGKLRIWNELGQPVGEFDHSSIPDQLRSNRDVVVIANGNNLSFYRRKRDGNWVHERDLNHDTGTIDHLAINSDSQRVVTCGSNGSTELWSLDGESIARLVSVGPVQKSRFSADGRWLATLDRSGRVNLWESKSGKPMSSAIFGPTKIEFLEWDRDRLLLGGNSESEDVHWVSEIQLPRNWHD